jgi:hypothetical protein
MLVEMFGPLVVSVVSAVIIWLLGEMARQTRARTNNEMAISAVERLTHTVATAVMELEQTVVPTMRSVTKDGKLTERDVQLLQTLVMTKVKGRLQPSVQKQAGRVVADIDGFLKGKIEQLVFSMKPTGGCDGSDADR